MCTMKEIRIILRRPNIQLQRELCLWDPQAEKLTRDNTFVGPSQASIDAEIMSTKRILERAGHWVTVVIQ